MSSQALSAIPGDQALFSEALLLTLFGQDTINVNRAMVDITGNVLSAIWLTHVLDQMPVLKREGRGWAHPGNTAFTFDMTGQECEQTTGITRAQQATCRKQLAQAGLISEGGSGRGKTVRYTLHLDRLTARIKEITAPMQAALKQSYAADRNVRGVARK
ncbi:MAG: hypothetical protein LBV61_07700 [Burkholderiaceae bacterium]|nr:hypothetical protein [Burkholderiaceae bacterium]